MITDEVVQFSNEFREMTEIAGKLGLNQEDLDALTGSEGACSGVGGPVGAAGFGTSQMAAVAAVASRTNGPDGGHHLDEAADRRCAADRPSHQGRDH